MGLVRQLLLGVGGCVEAEGRLSRHLQGILSIAEGHILAIEVAAVLLRTQIILVELQSRGAEQTMPGSSALIPVAFNGTHAEILHLLHGLGQEQPQAEPGQLNKPRILLGVDVRRDSTFAIDLPQDLHGEDALQQNRRHGQGSLEGNTLVGDGHFRFVGTGDGTVVACLFPLQLDLAVIVRGSAPQIQLHGLVQKRLAAKIHFRKQTLSLVKPVGKALTGNVDPAVGLLHGKGSGFGLPQLQRRLITVILRFQRHLVEAYAAASRQQRMVIQCDPLHLQPAAALCRNIQGQGQSLCLLGRNGGQGQLALCLLLTVAGQDPAALQTIGSAELHIILYRQLTLFPSSPQGSVDILVLHQASVGSAVGVDQTVHAEIAVVGEFAMVATVEVDGLAVFRHALIDGMVGPLPHKAAAASGVLLEHFPVVLNVSGAIAHGVDILTEDIGLVQTCSKLSHHLLHIGIHPAVQIQIGQISGLVLRQMDGAFVMGQAGIIKGLCPSQRSLKAAAVGTFIAHGPDNDRGAVLIPLDAELHSVHSALQKVGVVRHWRSPVAQLLIPALAIAVEQTLGTVALVVSLVDDHKSVFIAELIEHGGIGIVAGTHRIEVVSPEHPHIPEHMLHTDDRTGDRVRIVTVDATELDGCAVEQHHIVFDRDFTEANPLYDHLVGHFHDQGVQIGLFGIPQLGALHLHGCGVGVFACFIFTALGSGHHLLAVQQLHIHGHSLSTEIHAHLHPAIQTGSNKVVPNAVGGTLQQIHIPEDAAGAELVLVLHVGTVAPLQHQHRQRILAGADQIGDVKLGIGMGYLAVAHKLAVDPDIVAGVHALKIQKYAGRILIKGVGEAAHVAAAGILPRHIRGVIGDGEAHIGIVMLLIAMILPHSRHGNGVEAGHIVALFKELLCQLPDAGPVAEFPVTVQQLETVGIFSVQNQVVHPLGSGDVVGPVGLGVYMQGVQVLKIVFYEHGHTS